MTKLELKIHHKTISSATDLFLLKVPIINTTKSILKLILKQTIKFYTSEQLHQIRLTQHTSTILTFFASILHFVHTLSNTLIFIVIYLIFIALSTRVL